MNSPLASDLRQLAERHGIYAEFTDASGIRRQSSPETLRALLKLWNVDAGSELKVRPALAELSHANGQRGLEPVFVQWHGQPTTIRLPAWKRAPSRIFARIQPANGGPVAGSAERPLSLTARQRRPTRFPLEIYSGPPRPSLRLPALAPGYYDLEIAFGKQRFRSLVIVAPPKAFDLSARRDWGVFLPMYAAHSKSSWGAGNFSDWKKLCDSLASAAANVTANYRRDAMPPGLVVSTLPLLGAFLEEWKCDPSPYSPATRLFWNEFFVDVEAIPEFAACAAARKLTNSPAFTRTLQRLRAERNVDYCAGMRLRRQVLEKLAAFFFASSSPRRAEFDVFVKSRPELERYAAFRAACESQQRSWHCWPQRMRAGTLRPGDYLETVKQVCLYAQWIAQQQMDAVLAECRECNIRFYLDLPLGVDPDGYDVWRERDSFASGARVGAPPDMFFTKGQDWGFPPLHPERIRQSRYQYVIEFLRFQMRHTGLLRLDHVMGLHRLWWIPPGASAADGAYVCYRAEELYAILCLESHRHRTTLIGENLGTVPPEVNQSMARHGVRTLYVAPFEQRDDPAHALNEPAPTCVASLNTHDMPSWAAYWNGLDIADRQALGLLSSREAVAERKGRAHVRQRLARFLRKKRCLVDRANARNVLAALLKFLGRSRAELVLVNFEDLWLEPLPQNTPGTTTERVNWRRKTAQPLERLFARKDVRRLLTLLRRART